MSRRIVAAAIVVAALSAGVYALMRPAPKAKAPLDLVDLGAEREAVVRDRRGRPVISNFRAVERGVLYRGSAFPTSFPGPDGKSEYADETAFEFLRSLNVRHVLALVDTADKYYAEDGYLKFWSDRTGHRITTTWVEIHPTGAFSRHDQSGLRAAGILISLMRDDAAEGGAMYVHDLDGASHVGVAAAGYELWRNRGWTGFETTWTLVERRFRAVNRNARDMRGLRDIREDLRFLTEL
jgi:hypothetical protein